MADSRRGSYTVKIALRILMAVPMVIAAGIFGAGIWYETPVVAAGAFVVAALALLSYRT